MGLAVKAEIGCEVSKGVNTKVLSVRSQSAVNVKAVCGVEAKLGDIAGGDNPSGDLGGGMGDGGNISVTLLVRARRRSFLISDD